jgi:hypothetical protein
MEAPVSSGGRWARARGSAAVALALFALGLALPAFAGAATVQEPDVAIVLRGEGTDTSDFVVRLLDSGAATSEAEPLFDYIGSNESEGLRAFVDGRSEFYVGSLPLEEALEGSTDALAKGRGVISAPFQAVGVVPFMAGPYPRGFRWCDSGVLLDPDTFELTCPDPGGAKPLSAVLTNAPGESVRLYPEDLAILFNYSIPTDFWFEARFMNQAAPEADCSGGVALTAEDLAVPGTCKAMIDLPGTPGPASGVRTDRSAVNKYLQEYLRHVDKRNFDIGSLADVGSELGTEEERQAARDAYVITTRWPRSFQPSRSPDENLANSVASWLSFQTSEVPKGGTVALVHPHRARLALDLEAQDAQKVPPQPVTDLWITDFVHQGEVRSATPEAITKAVAAGGETPFYAAYNQVPGAWPFAWVNRIHFPERGLSVDQTNSAAMMLRLQMTVGQEKAAELGDGRLPPALVAEGLAAADALVASNCAAAEAKVVEEVGAGPYTPEGLGPVLEALGSVAWCQATDSTPAPPPTTTPPPPGSDTTTAALPGLGLGVAPLDTYVPPLGTASPLDSAPAAEVSAGAAPAAPAAGAAGADEGESDEEVTEVESIAAEMPLSLPGTEDPTMDRLATLVLGAGLFFLLRAVWRTGALQQLAGARA